jgi:hypothetical protein
MNKVGSAIETYLTTKTKEWRDEERRLAIEKSSANGNRRQGLTSEGWAGVMVLLGVLLAFLWAWRQGLL